MSLLTPIITQMELDRDRLRDLVNGDVDATVELEERTEKSIAGQVQERIDNLAIDLSTSVQLAKDARDDAQSARDQAASHESASESFRDQAQTARDEAIDASDGIIDARDQALDAADAASGHASSAEDSASSASSAKDDAIDAKDAAISARDAAQSAKDGSVDAKDQSEVFRNEAEIFRDQALDAGLSAGFIPRYEVDSTEVSEGEDGDPSILQIGSSTVFRIDGSMNWDLVFPDSEDFEFQSDRAQTVIVFVEDSGGDITWPEEISWAGGNEPELGTSWTNIVLFWTGSMWVGMESAKR